MRTIAGRVLDPNGKPVAGARLYLPKPPKGEHRAPDERPVERLLQATTDADGRFSFRTEPPPAGVEDRPQLVAVADGFAADWVDLKNATPGGELTLRLAADVPVKGRVLDLEGKPVAGATVHPRSVITTPEERLDRVFQTWAVNPDGALQRAGKHLYDPALAGLPDAVTTDADGRFVLHGVGRERLVALRIEGPTIALANVRVAVRAGEPVPALPRHVEEGEGMIARSGPPLYGPDFVHTAAPTRPITGTVRDRLTGKPLAGVGLMGAAAGAWWEDYANARTDADGRYRIVGLPKAPSYTVHAHAGEGRAYLPFSMRVGDAPGLTPLTADIGLVKAVVLTGRITDKATGRPVESELFYDPLKDNEFMDKVPGSRAFTDGVTGYRSDKEGRFRILILPGSGILLARERYRDRGTNHYTQVPLDPADVKRAYSTELGNPGPSFLAASNRIVHLYGHNAYKIINPPADAEAFTCDLQYDPGRTVTVRVTDPDGKPLAGVTPARLTALWSSAPAGGPEFTVTSLDPAEPRTLAFVHKERRLVGNVTLRGDEAGPVTVRLEAPGSITGRVVDGEGRPVPGLRVTVHYREDAPRALADTFRPKDDPVKTDADGRFRLDGLFPGLPFSVGLRKGERFLDTGKRFGELRVGSGAAVDLGEIRVTVGR
jgi:protocatechuate 3,4-dioxygenase beta subunit